MQYRFAVIFWTLSTYELVAQSLMRMCFLISVFDPDHDFNSRNGPDEKFAGYPASSS